MSGVKLCPNHFRPIRTMRPLANPKDRPPVYARMQKGTVVRRSTLGRWSEEAEAGRKQRERFGSAAPFPRPSKNSRKRRRDAIRAKRKADDLELQQECERFIAAGFIS